MGLDVPTGLAPIGSGPSAPRRRPGSVRRTSTIDFTFPEGMGGYSIGEGRARDLVTGEDGVAAIAAEARMRVVLDPQRRIVEMVTTPENPSLDDLIGQSSMGGHRGRLAAVAADEIAAATPLHLLLDDLPGATLVSGSAFRSWYGLERYLAGKQDVSTRVMTGVCTGYQEGSSALNPNGTLRWDQHRAPAVEIDDVDDDLAWHDLVDPHEISMRRARRLDVWVTGDSVHLDAFFQDSATLPEGGRQAIHEYALTAEADADNWVLSAIQPIPRVLPYDECPLAVPNTADLIGRPLARLRPTVLDQLGGIAGCTHLNDMMRSLADAPTLGRSL